MGKTKHIDVKETCCHSHDLFDANEAMIEAFETVMGRQLFRYLDLELEPEDLQEENEDNQNLCNSAWDIAKEKNFYTSY